MVYVVVFDGTADVATVSPLTNLYKSGVLYPVAAAPEPPLGLLPTAGVVFATRLRPNCCVFKIEAVGVVSALMVFDPDVSVVPDTVIV